MSWRIIEGDCVDAMRELDEASVDAIVCDPPYGLGFMGKEWDSSFEAADMPMRRNGAQDAVNAGAARQGGRQRQGPDYQRRMARDSRAFQKWSTAWATEALRVLKPGGHLLAFGGTRTYHRLACAIEDAGFEIRDCLAFMYGTGFPKSLDVSKAIDKAAGAEREITQEATAELDPGDVISFDQRASTERERRDLPATAAAAWQGWGTALKPAHEPIVLARKPLSGTVAANVTEHGTGALNIGGCRVGFQSEADERESKDKNRHQDFGTEPGGNEVYGDFSMVERKNYDAEGRWPANVLLDPEAGAILDEQSGERPGGNYPDQRSEAVATGFGRGNPTPGGPRQMGDSGGASRFFYCAKASRAERNAGLDGFEEREQAAAWGDIGPVEGNPRKVDTGHVQRTRNVHPTVKPIDLMRWLVRLVTPPGGTVLDPFTGSGTTGIAAALEGFDFLGIEREAEYLAIAEARIAWWEQYAGKDTAEILAAAGLAEKVKREHAERGQLALTDNERKAA